MVGRIRRSTKPAHIRSSRTRAISRVPAADEGRPLDFTMRRAAGCVGNFPEITAGRQLCRFSAKLFPLFAYAIERWNTQALLGVSFMRRRDAAATCTAPHAQLCPRLSGSADVVGKGQRGQCCMAAAALASSRIKQRDRKKGRRSSTFKLRRSAITTITSI